MVTGKTVAMEAMAVEQKIIESAVIFWFKDDDYKDGFKLWNYFKED